MLTSESLNGTREQLLNLSREEIIGVQASVLETSIVGAAAAVVVVMRG